MFLYRFFEKGDIVESAKIAFIKLKGAWINSFKVWPAA